MTESGKELHRTIQVACTKCGLQKKITGIPTQGIPRQQDATVHGPSFFPQIQHPTCIRCGTENFRIVSKPPDDAAATAPAQGWAGPAGGTKITR
jgi:ribosomal protein L37E